MREDDDLKVFEAKTLIDSMEDRAKAYKDVREKIDSLKKEFTDIVQLDDALQGKGADAIKGFYQGQIDVAKALLRLIDMQKNGPCFFHIHFSWEVSYKNNTMCINVRQILYYRMFLFYLMSDN